MNALKHINFSNNKIKTLPKSILKLEFLESLQVFSNFIGAEEIEWWDENFNGRSIFWPQKLKED